jgi:hypothetical protein
MKRLAICLFVLLCAVSFKANAQTKKETENWLIYYLNKYYSTDYDDNMRLKIKENGKRYGMTYKYRTYQYVFDENYFYVSAYTYEFDSLSIAHVIDLETERIDLRRVIKMEYEKDVTNEPDYQYTLIRFVFDDTRFDRNGNALNPPIIVTNDISKKDITNYRSAPVTHLIQSRQPESIKSNMEKRIAKAFEHLAVINNAPIIKEVF